MGPLNTCHVVVRLRSYHFCFYNKVNNGTRRSRKHYLLLLLTTKKKLVDTHARFGDDDEITRTATVTAVNSCRALSLPTVLSYAKSHTIYF